ncbi:MAG: polyprenyl synthetase family protein [Deltaproteobacteria bacterium]|nr:polyprenyl synthetase family protein [Deltaproteobacteria bacterium]
MKRLSGQFWDRVQDDLEKIETALKNNLNSHLDLVSEVAGHLLFSGGKRLRPLLIILCARICGYNKGDEINLSTAVEYLHAATLLHDDIVDGAALRRGKPVANSIWGNPITVLVGDFLLARASSIAAGTGKMGIIRVMAEIMEEMSQGEIDQLLRKGDLKISENDYMRVIEQKTAVLFQGACQTGAIIADAEKKKEKALSGFGLNLGIAFQLIDDLIDYISDTKTLGKEAGTDLKEGKLTLPVIHALKKASPFDRDCMERIIRNNEFSFHDFRELIELLEKYKGISYVKDRAAFYIQSAKESLSIFAPSEYKEILMAIADYTLVRNT